MSSGFDMNKVKLTILLVLNCFISANLLAKDKTIIIGVAEFPPYVIEEGYKLKNNKIGYGIDLDILIEALKRANYQYKIQFYPFARITHSLRNNIIDVTPSMFISTDISINKYILYDSGGSTSIYQLANKKNVIANVADLKGKTIGIVRGDYYGERFKEVVNELNLTLTAANNDKMNFQMLLHQRMDLLAINSVVGQFLIKQMNIATLVSESPLKLNYSYQGEQGEHAGIHFLFNLTIEQHVIEDIRKAVKSIHEDGFIDQLKANYELGN